VEAQIGGRSYWLDGTRQGDTRLDRLEVPDYHSGLPATAQGSELVALVPTAPRAPMVETRLDPMPAVGWTCPPRPRRKCARGRYGGILADEICRAGPGGARAAIAQAVARHL
jgi:hypothetical protein